MSAPVTAMSADIDVVDWSPRCGPIVDGFWVVGIITRWNLVRALARDDQAIAADVRRHRQMYGGADRRSMEVHEGQVLIGEEFHDATDRHVATVLAEAVPGVTGVHAIGPRETTRDKASSLLADRSQ